MRSGPSLSHHFAPLYAPRPHWSTTWARNVPGFRRGSGAVAPPERVTGGTGRAPPGRARRERPGDRPGSGGDADRAVGPRVARRGSDGGRGVEGAGGAGAGSSGGPGRPRPNPTAGSAIEGRRPASGPLGSRHAGRSSARSAAPATADRETARPPPAVRPAPGPGAPTRGAGSQRRTQALWNHAPGPVPALRQSDHLAAVAGDHLTGADTTEADQRRPPGAGHEALAVGGQAREPEPASASTQARPASRRPGRRRVATAGRPTGTQTSTQTGSSGVTSTAPPPDAPADHRDPGGIGAGPVHHVVWLCRAEDQGRVR